MRATTKLLSVALFVWALPLSGQSSQPPVPNVSVLLGEVQAHQAALEKTRENYTYLRRVVTTELKGDGTAKKTESEDKEVFYVNTHEVERTVRKNGNAWSPSDGKKEEDRVRKEVEKAEATPLGQSLQATASAWAACSRS